MQDVMRGTPNYCASRSGGLALHGRRKKKRKNPRGAVSSRAQPHRGPGVVRIEPHMIVPRRVTLRPSPLSVSLLIAAACGFFSFLFHFRCLRRGEVFFSSSFTSGCRFRHLQCSFFPCYMRPLFIFTAGFFSLFVCKRRYIDKNYVFIFLKKTLSTNTG